MKLNETIVDAVKAYANDIVESTKAYNIDLEVDVDFDEAYNSEETESATAAVITSKLGVVMVFPDFVKKGAAASIYNVGLAKWMLAEGFTEEQVNEEGKVFGATMPHNKKNVETLGYYLTHKIDHTKKFKV